MNTLKLAVIALGLMAMVACTSEESTTINTTDKPAQTEKEKTKVKIDADKGEVGYENEDVDVDVKVKPDPKD